ncbi:MAG: hypothetical protein WC197_02570 [Candidatus Gastranaerophilaceae bacterium]|jgi:hypothetical protein
MSIILSPFYLKNRNVEKKVINNVTFAQAVPVLNSPNQQKHNNFAYPNIASNIALINHTNIKQNISFSSNLLNSFDDISDFYSNPAEMFTIAQFSNIHSALMKHKINSDTDDLVFLTGDDKVDKKTVTKSITLTDRAKAESISSEVIDLYDTTEVNEIVAKDLVWLGDSSKAVNVSSERVFIGDNAEAQEINAKTTWLKDQAKATKVSSEKVFLRNNAEAQNINATDAVYLRDNAKAIMVYSDTGNVTLLENSNIKTLLSDENVDLKGQGEVSNIQTKGNQIILTGPIKLKEKIKFENTGIVMVKKDKNGGSARIHSSMVENGKLLFDFGNGLLGNPQDIFEEKMRVTLSEVKEPYYKKQLGMYGDIKSLKSFYAKNNPELLKKIDGLSSNDNQRKIELLFNKFLSTTLQNLANPEPKEFTTFWVNNKKIGNKSLTDFWLKSAGKDIKNKKPEEKRNLLNKLSKEEKNSLIDITTAEYVNNILPKELNRKNHTDLSEIEEIDQSLIEIKTEIEQNKKEGIINLIKGDGLQKLENIKIGDKNIIDFWIDTIDGDNEAKGYTKNTKIERLEEIFENPSNIDKIINTTLAQAGKGNNEINEVQATYSKLLVDSDLSAAQKELLKDYNNSKLFYLVVTDKWVDKTSKAKLKKEINQTTENLVAQQKNIEKNSRENIFNPVKDIKNVYEHQDNPEMQQKINFVFDILHTKIQSSDKTESQQTKDKLQQFSKEIEQNSDNIGDSWIELVNESQKYFETAILDKVTTKNIKLLYSMNNQLGGERDNLILDSLADKSLDKIEQKEFISRYKDDKNMRTMLENSGVNKKEAVDGLLYLEAINKQIFKTQSKYFRDNISIEIVKTNEDLANRYIRVLGKDDSPMSADQKTEFLAGIAPEELKLAARTVYKNWEEHDLTTFMSEKFVEVDHESNINAQGKNIVNELKKINTSLDKMNININGQLHTLEEISTNFNKFSDMYQVTQTAQHNELCNMAKQLVSINKNTMNIEANTKALVRKALKDVDPKLREDITALLPEEDRVDISKFLEKVDKLAKEEKDAKRKKQLLLIAAGVATLVGVGALAYIAAPAFAGTGVVSSAASVVNSAGVAHSVGSSLLTGLAKSSINIAFGMCTHYMHIKEAMLASSYSPLYRHASELTDNTPLATIRDWFTEAGEYMPSS